MYSATVSSHRDKGKRGVCWENLLSCKGEWWLWGWKQQQTREERCGFRSGRGFVDHAIALKNVWEILGETKGFVFSIYTSGKRAHDRAAGCLILKGLMNIWYRRNVWYRRLLKAETNLQVSKVCVGVSRKEGECLSPAGMCDITIAVCLGMGWRGR